MNYRLYWNQYKYLPYEKELAIKEVKALIETKELHDNGEYVFISTDESKYVDDKLYQLTYFSRIESKDKIVIPIQTKLEGNDYKTSNKRQSTRYSAHGIHEYKGKFNPQVVRAILNIFKIREGNSVIDPFSGSGTTMLECSHQNINAVGLDINPLALLIANSKQKAITTPAHELSTKGNNIITNYKERKALKEVPKKLTKREEYLLSWFPEEIFKQIETFKEIIQNETGDLKNVFSIILSNHIRDYSLQEPADLRIRRRKSPFPDKPLVDVFEKAIHKFVNNIRDFQEYKGVETKRNNAFHYDNRVLGEEEGVIEKEYFDAGITSPPYATALPYIDTQRLSLVWLGLIPANEIMALESELVGSRELKTSLKKEWSEKMSKNESKLPKELHEFCMKLQNSLGESDGFRRQAVPLLLYRYLSDMSLMFKNLLPYFKAEAPFALIVGHNQTTLGGSKFDIDTPNLLREIAIKAGWKHEESIELQTYQRYGIHHKNAVKNETLLIVRKP